LAEQDLAAADGDEVDGASRFVALTTR